MMMAMNATGAGMSMSMMTTGAGKSMMKGINPTGDVGEGDLTISNPASNQSVKIVDTYEQGSKNSLLLYNQTGNIK